jgi:hypothetical protein
MAAHIIGASKTAVVYRTWWLGSTCSKRQDSSQYLYIWVNCCTWSRELTTIIGAHDDQSQLPANTRCMRDAQDAQDAQAFSLLPVPRPTVFSKHKAHARSESHAELALQAERRDLPHPSSFESVG